MEITTLWVSSVLQKEKYLLYGLISCDRYIPKFKMEELS